MRAALFVGPNMRNNTATNKQETVWNSSNRIGYPGRERSLRTDHSQIHSILASEGQQPLHIRGLDRHTLGLSRDAGVAGGAEYLPHPRRTAQGIDDGMAATAATYHHHCLLLFIAFHIGLRSMLEMAHSGEEHRSTLFVGLAYGILVADAASGLHDCCHSET